MSAAFHSNVSDEWSSGTPDELQCLLRRHATNLGKWGGVLQNAAGIQPREYGITAAGIRDAMTSCTGNKSLGLDDTLYEFYFYMPN